jgi:methionyl-tRNA formyltransferase
MSAQDPLFAFFGTSVDSRFALSALERKGLIPALVVDTKTFPDELHNSEWDFFLVASYGKILPKNILDLPKHGCLNIHPSLLPKYRGPSPYVSAILADDRTTGVTLMQMAEKMDAGPIIAQARIEIDEAEWPPKGLMLSEMLFTEGVNLLAEALPLIMDGTLTPEPQDEAAATYTKKFADSDALIPTPDPTGRLNLPMEPQRQAFLKIRAFDKSPRAYFVTPAGKRVIVTEARWEDGTLHLERVLPEGKKQMSYEEYLRGVR